MKKYKVGDIVTIKTKYALSKMAKVDSVFNVCIPASNGGLVVFTDSMQQLCGTRVTISEVIAANAEMPESYHMKEGANCYWYPEMFVEE